MDNPFHRRATEQLRDDEAFLSIVSPHPLTVFLKRPVEQGTLYDRLVVIRGTPGSGKTTLVRLFEFSPLCALLRRTGSTDYESLAGALEVCGAIQHGVPSVLGCRLPMETDYRDFWEFPYSETLKLGLMTTFVQARAVLAWFRQLQAAGVSEDKVLIVPRVDAEAAIGTIGGNTGSGVAKKAREMEKAVYDVVAALVPPAESKLSPEATGAYHPFDVIEKFRIASDQFSGSTPIELRPLVILDDAHSLHPSQFRSLTHWLAQRELRIARWIVSRFDILRPEEALSVALEDRSESISYPGLSQNRDVVSVLLQGWGTRQNQRTAFRNMARDMAGRYLQKHSLLGPRRLTDIGSMLSEDAKPLSPSSLKELESSVGTAQRKLKVTPARRTELEAEIDRFLAGSEKAFADIQLMMLSILMHRYDKRIPNQGSFFEEDPEPSKPLQANEGVYQAARLQLMHSFERPYFYGIDDLCDASSENAELFLQLSATLVDTVATQVIRSKPALLTATVQHQRLRERGKQIIDAWDFPYVHQVRHLVKSIATKCVEVSCEPNAAVMPNAYGVLQADFEKMISDASEFARILQFAVAYNAILLVPRYECKGKVWCLMELGGPVCLSYGLTLRRGGFVEGSIAELLRLSNETAI